MNSLQNSFKALLLLFVLVAGSCKHEPPAEPTVPCAYDCSLDEMKNYYFFKTGTQWIYEEETTHQVDTFRVYEHYEYENGAFGFSLVTSLGNNKFHYDHFESMNYACNSNPECICRPIELARYNPLSELTQSQQIFYPHIQGNFVNVWSMIGVGNYLEGKSYQENVNAECEAGSLLFFNSIKYHTETNALYEGVATDYFFVRNLGLVKFCIYNINETWNLKSSHIIQ